MNPVLLIQHIRYFALATLFSTQWVSVSPAYGADVTLKSEDGQVIHAEHQGTGNKGILLIHHEGRDHQDFDPLVDKMATRGFLVLAIDLRGHGTSDMGRDLTDEDFVAMIGDVTASVSWLSKKGATSISLVGDRLGANLALAAAAADPRVTDVTMLSPGFNYRGISISPIDEYSARPLLLIASEGDTYASKVAGVIQEKATGKVFLEVGPGNEKGVKILTTEPDLDALLFSWLSGAMTNVTVTADDTEMKGPEGEFDKIETTGVKIGDR